MCFFVVKTLLESVYNKNKDGNANDKKLHFQKEGSHIQLHDKFYEIRCKEACTRNKT